MNPKFIIPKFIIPSYECDAFECNVLKKEVILLGTVHATLWEVNEPNSDQNTWKILSELETDYLENILITQSQLSAKERAAILMLLKRRYIEAANEAVNAESFSSEAGGPWHDLTETTKGIPLEPDWDGLQGESYWNQSPENSPTEENYPTKDDPFGDHHEK